MFVTFAMDPSTVTYCNAVIILPVTQLMRGIFILWARNFISSCRSTCWNGLMGHTVGEPSETHSARRGL
jgi:hypothetical protein